MSNSMEHVYDDISEFEDTMQTALTSWSIANMTDEQLLKCLAVGVCRDRLVMLRAFMEEWSIEDFSRALANDLAEEEEGETQQGGEDDNPALPRAEGAPSEVEDRLRRALVAGTSASADGVMGSGEPPTVVRQFVNLLLLAHGMYPVVQTQQGGHALCIAPNIIVALPLEVAVARAAYTIDGWLPSDDTDREAAHNITVAYTDDDDIVSLKDLVDDILRDGGLMALAVAFEQALHEAPIEFPTRTIAGLCAPLREIDDAHGDVYSRVLMSCQVFENLAHGLVQQRAPVTIASTVYNISVERDEDVVSGQSEGESESEGGMDDNQSNS
jgi:hypothetical protein